ncbi:uncharacterized protein THITE_44215, partial [Thermothielavioides terrestris NRRL 8126]
DTLNIKQRIIFDIFVSYYKAYLYSKDLAPILLQVDSYSGTSKSYIIYLLSA